MSPWQPAIASATGWSGSGSTVGRSNCPQTSAVPQMWPETLFDKLEAPANCTWRTSLLGWGHTSLPLSRRLDRFPGGALKVKFPHSRYRALGLELIPVYRQSARRWLFKSSPGHRLPITLPKACVYLVRWRHHSLRWQTSNCSSLLIYRPREDERPSLPGWLTFSGRFTHTSGHPHSWRSSMQQRRFADQDRRSNSVHATNLREQGCNHVFKVGGPIPWYRVLLPFYRKNRQFTQFGAVGYMITLFIKKLCKKLGVRPNFGKVRTPGPLLVAPI